MSRLRILAAAVIGSVIGWGVAFAYTLLLHNAGVIQ
jgi:hypothetical protein